MAAHDLSFRPGIRDQYPDIYTPEALAVLSELTLFIERRNELLQQRLDRRRTRILEKRPLSFLDPQERLNEEGLTVQQAREGRFIGSEIPQDLQRQWIQGTGPATRPRASLSASLRNPAYALLSGADGWMFDGEDALGQVDSMSLDNQRNLKLAISRDPQFLQVAEHVSQEMNTWAKDFLGREIIANWREQLDFTTTIFRPRGLHLDDRHLCDTHGHALPASIVDATLYVVNNYQILKDRGSSVVLYLPKIQTAHEAALWNRILTAIETHLKLEEGTIKAYVLVEQLEASFQLMEIRAALGRHFVGYNTGRWDYINSVSDAMCWHPDFVHPNIDAVTMTYGYMANYEQRVLHAANTPDLNGNCALWQGGMEANIPVGSPAGVEEGMKRALAGAVREQKAGASGKWVAHWKMVPIVRPIWEKVGEANQLGKSCPALGYQQEDANKLIELQAAPRNETGARALLSVGLQYGNAFLRGFQAAALKPADDFGNDDVLYLMEDMATGEIRLSILWEWIHKGAILDDETEPFSMHRFDTLLQEEYEKLLLASNKDVHDDSKESTLPIAREIVRAYIQSSDKPAWYIDLLNINLNNSDLGVAKARIARFLDVFHSEHRRLTHNPDFVCQADGAVDEFHEEVQRVHTWLSSERFQHITRLHHPREVVEQCGSLPNDYTVARTAAEDFYALLRRKFLAKETITTFGPYSPSQAVTIKRMGIEAIYLGGWATSAKGSLDEDPGPDLASYPLGQVPNEAASLVRALLTADKNQRFSRSRLGKEARAATPAVNYQPFIIADADTGHGGDAHVRNLIRRFVEVGVPGYHIEDQKPGVKKCGHQSGKVLVPIEEQIRRLNSARFQLDLMAVPGIIVARTDSEAATFLESDCDERDHAFILGATNPNVPSYKSSFVEVLRQLHAAGVTEVQGHLMFRETPSNFSAARDWLEEAGVKQRIESEVSSYQDSGQRNPEPLINRVISAFSEVWYEAARLKTLGEVIHDAMRLHRDNGYTFEISIDEWPSFAAKASIQEMREEALLMGLTFFWDCELARSTEGYYQIRAGIDYAITRSLAVAPFADLLWMETKTAKLEDAKTFADAIHAVYPEQMLAYNLSPSFNWDTTGMTEDEMRRFPEELGKLGYVFNFITYGGHQIDGLAAEEFCSALKDDGMLALARLQRKLRLIESPYRTPQAHVGGPRLDGALLASTGRTAATIAMGKASTHHQHLMQTELPATLLEEWLQVWCDNYGISERLKVAIRPHQAGSDTLALTVSNERERKTADVVFTIIHDRRGRPILSIRDENNFEADYRQKRLLTLLHVYLIARYNTMRVHYVSPNEFNAKQAEGMIGVGVYTDVRTEIGTIIVAEVNADTMKLLTGKDPSHLKKLIKKEAPYE